MKSQLVKTIFTIVFVTLVMFVFALYNRNLKLTDKIKDLEMQNETYRVENIEYFKSNVMLYTSLDNIPIDSVPKMVQPLVLASLSNDMDRFLIAIQYNNKKCKYYGN
jgi:hypothetical protein